MTILDRIKSPTDVGTFTVQSYDIPLRARTKPQLKKCAFTKAEVRSKKARLTPINEREEFNDDFDTKSFLSFDSLKCNEDLTMDHYTAFTDIDDSTVLYHETERNILHRSDTPVIFSKPKKKSSRKDELFDEELRMITEQPESGIDSNSNKVLTDLPPRPKCRLNVLPPDITGNNLPEPKKRRRIRRLRHKVDEVGGTAYKSSLIPNPLNSLGTKEEVPTPRQLSLLTRPKSADSGVQMKQFVTLPKIQKSKSTSVPDLPSVMNKLAKSKLKGDFKTDLEESGALGTPRGAISDRSNNTSCLRGSDMSSFYNMWEKTRISRVIGRQSPDKTSSPTPAFQRPCASMHKHDSRKHHFLPPL